MIMPTMEKEPRDIESDFFFNHPDEIDEMKEWSNPKPVDLNNAFVPVKGDSGNLQKTQENIRRRFKLGGEDE